MRRGVAPAVCLWPRRDHASLARGSCVRAIERTLRRMSPLYDSHTSMTLSRACERASVASDVAAVAPNSGCERPKP